MVITFKCDEELTFFNNADTAIEFKSEATNGNIEIVNDTKAEFKNSAGTIVASIDTDSKQCLINNKSISKISVVTENTDGNSNYTTENVINCICSRDCQNSDRTDELPSATSLVNAINNCQVGSTFYFILRNTGTNNVLTLGISLGGVTLTDIATIAYGNTSHWLFVVADIGTPTIVGYLINQSILTISSYVSTHSVDLTAGEISIDASSSPLTFPIQRAGNGSGAGDAWSLSIWVKLTTNTPTGNGMIFMYNNLNVFIFQKDNGLLLFGYGNGIRELRFTSTTNTISNPLNWHHILWTYAGGVTGADPAQEALYFSQFKMYIDGSLETTTNDLRNNGWDGAIPALSSLTFGKDSVLTGYSGKMDEMAVFDSDVSSDISNIYNGGNTRDLLTLATPPVHWWKIEPTTDAFPDMTDSIGTITLEANGLVVGDYSTDVP